ncbi:NUDIX hydrolase [Salininema proteolyticum]|uniref:NUDIX domain-containing protein n=1 Tax=Salininema proteolyticum TaxID=1607685 RepID=A0ABV8U4U3_9ACTN
MPEHCSYTDLMRSPLASRGRRAARTILIDDSGRLVLIKRTKPEQAPYYTTPGGGIEDHDRSPEAAMRRELVEELGAHVGPATQVYLTSSTSSKGQVAVQYYFVARLLTLDMAKRTGSEFADSSRGSYDIERVALRQDTLTSINLRPIEVRDFITVNQDALLLEVSP